MQGGGRGGNSSQGTFTITQTHYRQFRDANQTTARLSSRGGNPENLEETP